MFEPFPESSNEEEPHFVNQYTGIIEEEQAPNYKNAEWKPLIKITLIQFVSCFLFYNIQSFAFELSDKEWPTIVQYGSMAAALLFTGHFVQQAPIQKVIMIVCVGMFSAEMLTLAASGLQHLESHSAHIATQIYLVLIGVVSGSSFGVNQSCVYSYVLDCSSFGQKKSGLLVGIFQASEIFGYYISRVMHILLHEKQDEPFICALIGFLIIPILLIVHNLDIHHLKTQELDAGIVNASAGFQVPDSMGIIEGVVQNERKQPQNVVRQQMNYLRLLGVTFFRSSTGITIICQSIISVYFDIIIDDLAGIYGHSSSSLDAPDGGMLRHYGWIPGIFQFPTYIIMGFLQDRMKSNAKGGFLEQITIQAVLFLVLAALYLTSLTSATIRVITMILIPIIGGISFQALYMIACRYFEANYRVIFGQIFLVQAITHCIVVYLDTYIFSMYTIPVLFVIMLGSTIMSFIRYRNQSYSY